MLSTTNRLPIYLLTACALSLSGCERDYNQGVRDGDAQGYKRGYNRGEAVGLVEQFWVSSVGTGVCLGFTFAAFIVTVKLLSPPGRSLVKYVIKISSDVKEHYQLKRRARTLESRNNRVRESEDAFNEACAKIEATTHLQRTSRFLSRERIQLEVERFVAEVSALEELRVEVGLYVDSAQEAISFINAHPNLTQEQKGHLLAKLESILTAERLTPA